MRIVFYNDFRLGVLRDSEVIDIHPALGNMHYSSPQDLINQVISGWEELKPVIEGHVGKAKGLPLNQVRLRAPVPKPPRLMSGILSYLEDGKRPPADPDFFLKSPSCVIGDGDTVELPPVQARVFHHEAELAAVIGKTLTKASPEEALQGIFGYVNFIDVSLRGLMPNGMLSFFLGKSWDTFGPMGPAIVTADELSDPQCLQVRLWVNGELRHDYNTNDMARSIGEVIAFVTSVTTLEPGDVIALGTNHQGLGAIQNDDTMEMEIMGLGRLTVKVHDSLNREWPRGVDKAEAEMVVNFGRK